MKKSFISFFLFVSLFFQIVPQSKDSIFADILNKSQSQNHKNQDKKYNSSVTEIQVGNNTLFTQVYYFDTEEEGAEIAEEIYKIKDFSRFEKIPFKKLRRIVPGDKISKYEFGMFKSYSEFWILKNKGDGWLYGKGFFVDLIENHNM